MTATLSAPDATMWWTALALGLVVTLVVAALLALLYRQAQRIETLVAGIWEAGQRVANNTVHIPLLYRTDEAVTQILTAAGGIAQSAAAIESHANGCPGCPQCLLKH
jgi:hypothetical protein